MSQDADLLATSQIGAFEAEKIDGLDRSQVKKQITALGIFTKGLVLPEQGTWHLDRKKAILKEHPEVKQLYGQNPLTAFLLVVILSAHTYYSYYFSTYSWIAVLIGSYTVGAWLSFVLQVIGHEGTHRLVSKTPAVNKLVAVFAFLPVFLGPFGTLWMFEHMWHHNVVVDKCVRYGPQSNPAPKKALMTLLFIGIVNIGLLVSASILGLCMLVTIPMGLLGLRKSLYPTGFKFNPYNRFPQAINGWTAFNIFMCAVYNIFVFSVCGWKGLAYQFLSAMFMNGLHPLGMRQVQEHYYIQKGQPTNSVYTPVHTLCLNIGHHVEHHDFATIPWNRLPMLSKLAPEYYMKSLKYYNSYTQVLIEFFTNPGISLEELFGDQDGKH